MTEPDKPLDYYEAEPTFRPRVAAPSACSLCKQAFTEERARAVNTPYPNECEVCARSHEKPADILVTDPNDRRINPDIQLVRHAARRRWKVPPATQDKVVERLTKIVDKDTVEVMTKEGPVSLDGPADENAVRAAAVLAKLTEIDQKDDHLDDKNERLDTGKATDRVSFAPVVIERPWKPGDAEEDQLLLPETKEGNP